MVDPQWRSQGVQGVLKPPYHLGFHGSPPSLHYKFCGGRRKEKILKRKKKE
jgi:hypothetical protein